VLDRNERRSGREVSHLHQLLGGSIASSSGSVGLPLQKLHDCSELVEKTLIGVRQEKTLGASNAS
jgi:hypothetical protein